MNKVIWMPSHQPPILHENACYMSYENASKLKKIYQEIIGIESIDHVSLNLVDSQGKMSIFSYKPQIAYNIFKDGTYLYNGSISPTFYNNKDIYTWEESYDSRYFHVLKNNMERKNGIEKGVVLIQRAENLIKLFSFATKANGIEFFKNINEKKELFYKLGDHCFQSVRPIFENYILNFNQNNKEKEKKKEGSNIIRLRQNVYF